MSHIRANATTSASTTTASTAVSKLSEADKDKEISRIKRENSNIFQNLSVLEGELRAVNKSATEQLRYLAQNYERLFELGDYKEPVNHICATISRLCEEKKLPFSAQLARLRLDPKYKQTEFTSHNNLPSFYPTAQIPGPNVDPTQSNSMLDTSLPRTEDNSFYQIDYNIAEIMNSSGALPGQSAFVDPNSAELLVQDKPIEELTRDEIRRLAEARVSQTRKARELLLENRRREKEALEVCARRKIALSPEFEQLPANHISAISPDSGPSEAWYEAIELYNDYGKLCDKLHRWRPPKDIQKDMVDAFKADREFLAPFIDEKYRQSQPQWWVTQINNLWYGKHAAAVMSYVPLDERTKRDLTREQVGDRSAEDLARAIRFSAAVKKWAMLWKWFDRMNKVGIAKRAKELGPTLSEKAFS